MASSKKKPSVKKCQAKHREKRGSPWEKCPFARQVRLHYKGKSWEYCRDCANGFIDAFPKNTFRVEEL